MRCVRVRVTPELESGWQLRKACPPVRSINGKSGSGAELEKDSEIPLAQARAFECDGCGESFTSWERLRQHQVDCKSDDSNDWL